MDKYDHWLGKLFLGLFFIASPLHAADFTPPPLPKEVHWHTRVSSTWTKAEAAVLFLVNI